jgi:hypothetical protein
LEGWEKTIAARGFKGQPVNLEARGLYFCAGNKSISCSGLHQQKGRKVALPSSLFFLNQLKLSQAVTADDA